MNRCPPLGEPRSMSDREGRGSVPASPREEVRACRSISPTSRTRRSLRLCAREDEAALAELYDRYGRVSYGLAAAHPSGRRPGRGCRPGGLPRRLALRGRFVPERAKASTWILTLVHRRAVDRCAEASAGGPSRSTTSRRRPSGTDGGARWLRFERERIQLALKKLPDQQREALELAYYGGSRQSELAERLGQPLGTIKSRMFAGLEPTARPAAETGTEDRRWKPTDRRADRGARPRLALARGRARARGAPAPISRRPGAPGRAPGGGCVTRVRGRDPGAATLTSRSNPRRDEEQEPTNVVPLRRRGSSRLSQPLRLPPQALRSASASGARRSPARSTTSAARRHDRTRFWLCSPSRTRAGSRSPAPMAPSSSRTTARPASCCRGSRLLQPARPTRLWVIEDDKPVSAGLFSGGSSESVVPLTKPVPEGATVAVTVEPAGGVDQPTTTPVVVAPTA